MLIWPVTISIFILQQKWPTIHHIPELTDLKPVTTMSFFIRILYLSLMLIYLSEKKMEKEMFLIRMNGHYKALLGLAD
ncbi:hypothetical protein SDC9_205427 [bioreactor metagenome]|uniref:Uncharacterized protein n=1 Tax=bioreactor metagenome TaxID=1076179 RepID=A0A645JDU8_9ZZZZ